MDDLQNRDFTGSLVDFFERRKIITGACLGMKQKKLHLLTETNREMNLSPKRILFVTPDAFSPGMSPGDMVKRLREKSVLRSEIAMHLDLASVWQSLNAPGESIALKDLAELVFGGKPSRDQQSALVRAIQLERIHFLITDDTVDIQTGEYVRNALEKKEKQAARLKEQAVLAQWLKARFNGTETPDPPKAQRLVNGLIALAVNQQDQPDKIWVKEILKQSGVASVDTLFAALVKMRFLHEDENLELIRNEFPITFSPQALEEIPDQPVVSADRIDLTGLDCFTIDSPETLDMDDAVSCKTLPDGGCELGIHITDVSAYVLPGGFLDQEARERSQTLYMPDRIYPMFPKRLSENIASLIVGAERPAITTLVTFDRENTIRKTEIISSVIRVKKKLDYDYVDTHIQQAQFDRLHKIAVSLREARKRNGAIIMPHPEISLRVDTNGTISIQRRNRETPSQLIVSECMILANRLAAQMAAETGVPFPFRCQKPPKQAVPVSPDTFDPVTAYRQRRLMNRASGSTSPAPHYSLGLAAYTNITSPLRRYFDLLAQRQLKSIIGSEEPYSRDELDSILLELDATFARSGGIVSARVRYWVLKHLMKRRGEMLRAVVQDRFPHRYQVWIEDYCMDGDVPIPFGVTLTPGQSIRVVVERVNPRANILKLRYVD